MGKRLLVEYVLGGQIRAAEDELECQIGKLISAECKSGCQIFTACDFENYTENARCFYLTRVAAQLP